MINNYVSKDKDNQNRESEKLDKLLKKLSEKNIDENIPTKNMHVKNLVGHIEEYLNSFIIVGYDINNDPVMIRNALTHKDLDALNHSIVKYMSMNQISETGSDIGDFDELDDE